MKSIVFELLVASMLTQNCEAVQLTGLSAASDLPDQFNTATLGDPFMETVLSKYSVQEKGTYYVPYDKAKSLAFDVLTLDAGMSDGDAKGTIGGNFDKFWSHYDVLSEGRIQASQIVPFYQRLAHDSTL